MSDVVWITVRYKDKVGDMELPTRISVNGMEDALRRAARLHFSDFPIKGGSLLLRTLDGYIHPNKALADYGIFDGATLEIELVGGDI